VLNFISNLLYILGGLEKIMTNDNVISALNNLIETCKDGQEGFKDAAEGVQNSELKTLFYDLSQQRSKFSGELQQEVRSLGGDPEDSGSVSGSLHRGWINIKSAVTGQDETAILNECERGEDAAVKAYKEAMDNDLPANVSETVTRQYEDVQAAHDKVKAKRNQSRGASS
jgi:uncharacterized protein (TIGR02284 family)